MMRQLYWRVRFWLTCRRYGVRHFHALTVKPYAEMSTAERAKFWRESEQCVAECSRSPDSLRRVEVL